MPLFKRSILFYSLLFILFCYRFISVCGISFNSCSQIPLVEVSFIPVQNFRTVIVRKIHSFLPSPHSELCLGMSLGVDLFHKLPQFKDALIVTGTIHVVVVSGYNIALVYTFAQRFFGSLYVRRNLILGVLLSLFYVVLVGAGAPVIRAWIMGSLAFYGKYYGRALSAVSLTCVSGLLMVCFQPLYLFDVSFQLSFMATLSLVLFSGFVAKLAFVSHIPELFREDFATSASAQILVWPLLSYHFGRISLLSLLVNGLVLWVVTPATLLSCLLVCLSLGGRGALFVFSAFTKLVSLVLFYLLDYFVTLVNAFSQVFQLFPWFNLSFQIPLVWLLLYYFAIFYLCIRHNLHSSYTSNGLSPVIQV